MTKQDPYWFFKKWGFPDPTPGDVVFQKLEELEEKYNGLLLDVKRLEEENIETSNVLYELMNSIEAVDRRIDILAERCRIDYDV
jgi:hypothetical protein